MAFELMESKYKVAKLPDNMVSINKSAVSFGDNYANILLSNGRVSIYLDKKNNKVGFKPTSETKSSYKVQVDRNSPKRVSIGNGKIAKLVKTGRYPSYMDENGLIVIDVLEIADQTKASSLVELA